MSIPTTRRGKREKRREYTNGGVFYLSKDFPWHILITLCNPCRPLRLQEWVSCYLLSQRMKEDGGSGGAGRGGAEEEKRGSL